LEIPDLEIPDLEIPDLEIPDLEIKAINKIHSRFLCALCVSAVNRVSSLSFYSR